MVVSVLKWVGFWFILSVIWATEEGYTLVMKTSNEPFKNFKMVQGEESSTTYNIALLDVLRWSSALSEYFFMSRYFLKVAVNTFSFVRSDNLVVFGGMKSELAFGSDCFSYNRELHTKSHMS